MYFLFIEKFFKIHQHLPRINIKMVTVNFFLRIQYMWYSSGDLYMYSPGDHSYCGLHMSEHCQKVTFWQVLGSTRLHLQGGHFHWSIYSIRDNCLFEKHPQQGFHSQQKGYPKQDTHSDFYVLIWDLKLPANFNILSKDLKHYQDCRTSHSLEDSHMGHTGVCVHHVI